MTIRYSVIVPVFNNQDSITRLVSVLTEFRLTRMRDLEVVFVIDGSHDQSREILVKELQSGALEAQLIDLSRNFGSFSAIRAGLIAARGDLIAVMAADLQEPISLVEDFFSRLETGRCDIVVGRRLSRNDPFVSSVIARSYWKIYRRLVSSDYPTGGVDSFGCTRKVAEVLNALGEKNTSLVGLLYWIGFRREEVPYDRKRRHSGRSGWTFGRKFRYFSDSVFAFSTLPLKVIQVVGFGGTLSSVLVGLIVVLAWIAGSVSISGYVPIMLAILGSASMILLALGVIGSYVWRTYENSQHRPVVVQRSRRLFGYGVEDPSRKGDEL